MIIIDSIIGFDALYESMQKCATGVSWKDSVAAYKLNAIERTINLERELSNGHYKAKPPTHFMISAPKPREIASIAFRDRVYQRSLNDNAVYPAMTKPFILANCACQKGKGTDYARSKLEEYLRSYYRQNGNFGYVAQFDIHGYYPNMPHSVAESEFKENLNDEEYERVERILREQYPGDKGYNPGSQLIQIAGISVLNKLDHYVKEQLRSRYYIRYMDDFLIIHHDENYLEYCAEKIAEKLSEIGFELNEKKTRIFEISEGIEFLGFDYNLTDSGKVVKTVRSANVKRERKKLRRLVAMAKRGEIPKSKVDESYCAWKNHASHGNSYNLIKRMDQFYSELWGDYNDQCKGAENPGISESRERAASRSS